MNILEHVLTSRLLWRKPGLFDDLGGGYHGTSGGGDRFAFGKPWSETGSDHISDFVSGFDYLAFMAIDFGFAPGHVQPAPS